MLHDLNELVNPGLTSHLQEGHMETEPRSKASSERQEKRGVDIVIPGLVV